MCGVPQGSVQVHRVHIILFPFFGIVQSFTDISYHVYADDSQLYVPFRSHHLDRVSTLHNY